jgi:hypothetical protein
MTPAPPAVRRLSLLGCALVTGAALVLPGCGDSGGATAETAATPTAPQKRTRASVAAGTAGAPCPAPLGAFVRSLDSLRRQLTVGLSYDPYTTRVKALRAGYEKLPIRRFGLACLTASGTPAERSFDKYVDAANAWGQCLAEASCETATIEPVLQHKWRLASRFLSAAE